MIILQITPTANFVPTMQGFVSGDLKAAGEMKYVANLISENNAELTQKPGTQKKPVFLLSIASLNMMEFRALGDMTAPWDYAEGEVPLEKVWMTKSGDQKKHRGFNKGYGHGVG